MRDRIEQAINRIERDLENLSSKAQEILSENGEYLRELNDLINHFEGDKMELESKIEECKSELAKLNEAEVEKRAQLKILKEVF